MRVTYMELAVLTNVGVQTDNVHIKDFFPLLDFVVCFCGLGSIPVKGISNIYWRMLHIGVRAKFILEARIITQEFFKLSPPDRNNCITSVSYFLQPRLCLLIQTQQSFVSVADELMSIGHTLTHVPKKPKYSKTSLVSAQYPSTFTFDFPGK